MKGRDLFAAIAAVTLAGVAWTPASASEDTVPVYDYISVSAVALDDDTAANAEQGVEYDVSWSFAERFRFFAGSGDVGDASNWEAGFGYHVLTGERTSFFLDYAHFAVDDPARFNADGKIIRLGLRNRQGESGELKVSLENRHSVQIDETVFGLGWRYYWTDRLSSSLEAGVGRDLTEYSFDLRLDF